MDVNKDFLNQLAIGFEHCGFPCQDVFSSRKKIGFGVSGGADSMALLFSSILLREGLFKNKGADFVVVSINHNIRSKEESLGDCLFVKDFCERFPGIDFILADLEPGRVEQEAQLRGRGIEEAARFLRYEIFQSVIKEKKCDFFCLAHNHNDQLETLLLRFLQGSGDGVASGIPVVREKFLRPMLQISRKDIEAFLAANDIGFCQDKTNEENDYLRNRCRNLLIPLLNKEFSGWNKAVVTGAEKRSSDNNFIASFVPRDFWKEDGNGNLYASWKDFFSLHPALRRRVLFQGLNLFGVEQRVPFYLLEPLISWKFDVPRGRIFSFGQIELLVQKELIIIRMLVQEFAEIGFSLLVEKAGYYTICSTNTSIEITEEAGIEKQCLFFNGKKFIPPFIIRNSLPGDKTLIDGKEESVQEVLQKNLFFHGKQFVVVEEIGKLLVSIIVLS